MTAWQRERPFQFIVSIWYEETAPAQREWRGEVRDVRSGAVHYFRSWPELVTFIANQMQTRR